MGQAQKKSSDSARVRTAPPPLPTRSGIAPVAKPRDNAQPRSTLPPLAALHSSVPDALSQSAPRLALFPQWEDANASLRPAPKKSKRLLYWIASTTLSIGTGALVAASLMTVRAGDYAQIVPHTSSQPTAAAIAPQAPAAAAPSVEEFDLSEVEAAAPVVLVPELEVTSSSVEKAKPSKRTKPAGRGTSKRREKSMPAVVTDGQPDPREEAEETEEASAETQATEAPAADSSEATPAALEGPAVEAVVTFEPPKPALPEKLTRDQVRAGLDGKRSQVLACAHGTYGKVLADVTIGSSGSVSNVEIEGTFAGTNAAACMAKALSTASFPAFAGPDISVRYPYSF
jgi:hypothetical protein